MAPRGVEGGRVSWVPAAPGPDERDPRPVRESLRAVAARLGLPDPGVLGQVFTHWEELVGPDVAAHAAPRSLRDGRLTVAVDHPAWATSLRLLTGDLLRRAEMVLGPGTLKEVSVAVEGAGGRQDRKHRG